MSQNGYGFTNVKTLTTKSKILKSKPENLVAKPFMLCISLC